MAEPIVGPGANRIQLERPAEQGLRGGAIGLDPSGQDQRLDRGQLRGAGRVDAPKILRRITDFRRGAVEGLIGLREDPTRLHPVEEQLGLQVLQPAGEFQVVPILIHEHLAELPTRPAAAPRSRSCRTWENWARSSGPNAA